MKVENEYAHEETDEFLCTRFKFIKGKTYFKYLQSKISIFIKKTDSRIIIIFSFVNIIMFCSKSQSTIIKKFIL